MRHYFTPYARQRAIEANRERLRRLAADRGEVWPKPKRSRGRPPYKLKLAIAYCIERIADGDTRPEHRQEHVALRRNFGKIESMRKTSSSDVYGRRIWAPRKYRTGGVQYSVYHKWFPLVLRAYRAGNADLL